MEKKENRDYRTILVIVSGLLIIFLLTKTTWLLYIIVGVVTISAISVKAAEYIVLVWSAIGSVLKLIVPKIILAFIFYFFLFPIALLSRVFGQKDPLMLKNKHKTLFRVTDKTFDKASFERPW
jgi:hypothetical protein